jgi:hypothetical protein
MVTPVRHRPLYAGDPISLSEGKWIARTKPGNDEGVVYLKVCSS